MYVIVAILQEIKKCAFSAIDASLVLKHSGDISENKVTASASLATAFSRKHHHSNAAFLVPAEFLFPSAALQTQQEALKEKRRSGFSAIMIHEGDNR